MDANDEIKSLFTFLISKEHRPMKRLDIFLLLSVFLIGIDNWIGFSYYYGITHKLESLEKIGVLLKNDSLPVQTRKSLLVMQQEVLTRQDFLSELWSFRSLAMLNSSSKKSQSTIASEGSIIDDRDPVLNFITTSGVFFFNGHLLRC